MTKRITAGGIAALLCLLAWQPAAAERGWVRGAPLNLRSGPGNQYRIVGSASPGERMDIVQRGDGWTKVATEAGKQGWIAAGYLDAQAPPKLRLGQLEEEAAALREQLASSEHDAESLRTRNAELSGADQGQREELERLTLENTKLRAGERWAEWITGALILSTGMALGALVSRVSARRGRNRLRL